MLKTILLKIGIYEWVMSQLVTEAIQEDVIIDNIINDLKLHDADNNFMSEDTIIEFANDIKDDVMSKMLEEYSFELTNQYENETIGAIRLKG